MSWVITQTEKSHLAHVGDVESTATYRCGAIEIDGLQRQVLIDGAPARIGARAFDVLVALIERRERIVSKYELMDVVWPNLVVEENNLLVHIVALRKLLGAHAIVTIPGHGYRFAMPVETTNGGAFANAAAAVSGAIKSDLGISPPPFGGAKDERGGEPRMHDRMILSIIGADGNGKAHLALSAVLAAWCELPDGRWWLELAPVPEGTQIPPHINRAGNTAIGRRVIG